MSCLNVARGLQPHRQKWMHLEHYRTWGVEHSTTGRAFLFTYTAHYVRGCLLHGRCVSPESFSRPHCVGCRGDFYIHTRAGKKQSTRTNRSTQDTTLRRRHHRGVVRRRPGRPLSVWPPRRLLPNVVHVVSQLSLPQLSSLLSWPSPLPLLAFLLLLPF